MDHWTAFSSISSFSYSHLVVIFTAIVYYCYSFECQTLNTLKANKLQILCGKKGRKVHHKFIYLRGSPHGYPL